MGVIEQAKEIAKLVQDMGQIEVYKKVLDLQSELLALTEERNNLRKDFVELKEKFATQSKLSFEDNTYWMVDNDQKVGPFCPSCWDGQKKLSRLLKAGLPQHRKCNLCGQVVRVTPI